MPTPDLMEELRAIQAMAQKAQARLRAGTAVNGVASLMKIEKRAEDAIRHASPASEKARS